MWVAFSVQPCRRSKLHKYMLLSALQCRTTLCDKRMVDTLILKDEAKIYVTSDIHDITER